jgi:hypothetical protein
MGFSETLTYILEKILDSRKSPGISGAKFGLEKGLFWYNQMLFIIKT